MQRWAKVAVLLAVAAMVAAVVLEPRIGGGGESSRSQLLPAAEARAPATASAAEGASDAGAGVSATVEAVATEEAISPFEQLQRRLEADATDIEAWKALGQLLLANQDYTRAAEAFAAALEIESGDARARADLGAALLYQGMVRVARAELRRAIELDPSLVDAQLNLGVTFSHTTPTDIPAARGAWETVIDLAPSSEFAVQAREYLAAYPVEAASTAAEPSAEE
jgi:cytochrome c-type biogenesis protein CcmH/NrfG